VTPRRALLGAAVGLPLALVTIVAVEAYVAVRADYLPTDPGYRVDGYTVPATGSVADALQLLVLGDSTVAGVGSTTAEESLAVLIAERVADRLGRPVDVTGLGLSGARTDDIAADQIPRIEADPDVVVVVIGSNDVTHFTPLWGFESRTRRMLTAVGDATDAPVVLGGIPQFRTVPALAEPLRSLVGRYAVPLREAQRAAAASTPGTTFVDIAAEASPRFIGRPESMSSDGFHPSEIGYGMWADALAPAVAEAATGTTAP